MEISFRSKRVLVTGAGRGKTYFKNSNSEIPTSCPVHLILLTFSLDEYMSYVLWCVWNKHYSR
jgi:hypothetical protein